jgi:hypothetical protein
VNAAVAAATDPDGGGRLSGTSEECFGGSEVVAPRKLSREAKIQRWKQNWFPDVTDLGSLS